MARFFIDRPVFAIVISLFLMLIGTLSLLGLPIARIPEHRAADGAGEQRSTSAPARTSSRSR